MSESRVRYKKKEFIIFSVRNGFIVYNTKKEFKEGHTHLNNFKACKNAIYFVLNRKIPKDKSKYYLNSLKRISNDKNYIYEIDKILET
jgi:hypothetical protein